MRHKLSLRRRVSLAWLLFGAALSIVLALVAVAVNEDFEHTLVESALQAQAHFLLDRLDADPEATLPSEAGSRVYARVAGRDRVPAEYARFDPGFHEIHRDDGTETHVVVFARGADRVYFVLDLAAAEARERRLTLVLLLVIALGTLLSGWAGDAFAGRVIRPVTELADRVDQLRSTHEPALAAHFPRDDVGSLAAAVDRYQERLRDAAARERAFTADASHELRTPIAVIRGAAEVLADDPDLDEASRARVHRLQRGIAELGDLLDALLLLARGFADPGAATTPLAWRDAFEAVAGERRTLWRAQALDVVFDATDDAVTTVHPRVAEVLLANLIRHGAPVGRPGRLVVRAEAHGLVVAFRAATDAPAVPVTRFDGATTTLRSDRIGGGIGMIARVATQLGWTVAQAADDAGASRIVVRFGADPPSPDQST